MFGIVQNPRFLKEGCNDSHFTLRGVRVCLGQCKRVVARLSVNTILMWKQTPVQTRHLNEVRACFETKYSNAVLVSVVLHVCTHVAWFFIMLHLAIVSSPSIKWYWILQCVWIGVETVTGTIYFVYLSVGISNFLAVLGRLITERTGFDLESPATGATTPQLDPYRKLGEGPAAPWLTRLGHYEEACFERVFSQPFSTSDIGIPYCAPFLTRVVTLTQTFQLVENSWPRPALKDIVKFAAVGVWILFYPMVGAFVDYLVLGVQKLLQMCRASGRHLHLAPSYRDTDSSLPAAGAQEPAESDAEADYIPTSFQHK